MAFLDDLEKLEDQPDAPPQHMRYDVIFFIKDTKSAAQIDDKSDMIPGLRKTQIVLESLNYRQALRVMHQCLGKLFDACGVEHSMTSMGQDDPLPKKRYISRNTFVSWDQFTIL
jgi:hypothetical protein